MKSPANILITGASSGIGTALAMAYAAAGVTLCLSGRDRERLASVAAACRDKGAVVTEAVLDVTDRAAMAAWVVEQDEQNPLDLVIANAGISGGTGGCGLEPEEQVRRIFAVNLDGVLNTVEPILPRMAARRAGQVALMSSMASFSGWPGAPAYSASKGAVRLYGEALRGSFAKKDVKINVICPGFIETPMTNVNKYAMPFMMSAEGCASVIVKGLQHDRGRIAFPWQTYVFAGFFGVLPYWLSWRVLSLFPAKPGDEM